MSDGASASIAITGLVDHVTAVSESHVRSVASPSALAPPAAVAARLQDLIGLAAVDDSADHVSVVSSDASYVASIPLAEAFAGGLVFVGSDTSLAASVGGPFRLVVNDGHTLCWNVKDVGELRLTRGKERDSVPERPTH